MIKKILIVDDDLVLCSVLIKALTLKGYLCLDAESGEQAYEMIKKDEPDLVLSDVFMGGMDGIEFMNRVKKEFPDLDFIIMTGFSAEHSYADIINAGACDYMTKPFEISALFARIERIKREKRTFVNLKKSNQKLALAMDQAEAASNAKTEFLARMSHEIRTPLNGIIGYTDILFDTSLTDEQQGYVKNTKICCGALLSVVNDILDFSKVEAGELVLEKIEFDPEILCFETLELVRSEIDETRIELVCCISDSVPGIVKGDPHRFRQVLLNLLGNAAKFTSQGRIELLLDTEDETSKGITLSVSVRDTGIGVSIEQTEELFKPFKQSDETITREYGGTGLGLTICKKIVEKMNGTIQVESEPFKGSRFYFTAVVEKVIKKSKKRIRPALLSGKKVFVFACTRSATEILTRELFMAGMEVDCLYYSGSHKDEDKLAEFFENYSKRKYEIGIIDAGGYHNSRTLDIAKQIRQLSDSCSENSFIPLIACSLPVPGGVEECQKAGFDGFLAKPVQRKKLFSMMSGLLGIDRVGGKENEKKIATPHSIAEDLKRSISILVVEDNYVNQKMTKILLSKAGYNVDIANNGSEAFKIYFDDPLDFDIIFMDINMPVMDGLEATRRIRLREKEMAAGTRIPIIALTANVLKEFKTQCFDAGMDDFLTKPIKRELVFKAVKTWVA